MTLAKKVCYLIARTEVVHIRVTNFLTQMTGNMAACSGSTATTVVRNHRYCRSSVITSKLKRQGFSQVRAASTITVGDTVGIGSTVSNGDIRLDRRHIVGLLLLGLSQLHRVSPLEGLRPS
jgi:hypothetical protein